ncbi:hypothetical protein FOVG_11219 [Fusarium oxysporum f. sp. pisi HDV247]|uniref:Beta-xylosidase C-terminal Concanavalin A-like domain-containing protein n=1 Tax=Fusarium oxysporum f. sp. pisi HDV247 TaxID=1080344 RepID=W9PBX6_FUSOX|nr:hypothetical protein FOVG_11219 [Fusarium oxysporum f. sp. pisi HDV247]
MERVKVNPIIPGFAPDPSVIYVDGTYFLVNSSFHMFPGLPVYASRDLKEWSHIGNALNRTGLMSLQRSMTKLVGPDEDGVKIAAQGGLMAPSIRYHKGTFYIVCTNIAHKDLLPGETECENFILSTTDIWADEWSDPVFYDFYGIDTSLFWDDDDRAYLIGARSPAPASQIWQFEIDVRTGKDLSERRLLWEGVTKVYPEGPHMYKKDGWYYLLIAEGGCFADHHVIMARSRDIWGPYEVNPANPVLPKADPNGYIQYTGHGDLFQHPSGQWYFVCLGVRKNNGRFIMGRESVLTTASWSEGEFPVIDGVQVDVPLPIHESSLSSNFSIPRKFGSPDVAYLQIRDPVPGSYEHDGKGVTLTSSKADLNQDDEPVTFIGKRQRSLHGTSSATLEALDSSIIDSRLMTGLCYYKDEHRYARVFLDVNPENIVFELVNKARSIERTLSVNIGAVAKDNSIVFGIDYAELDLVFWYSLGEDGTRREMGTLDSLDMTGHDFVGPVIGVFATGNDQIRVKYLDITVV